MQRRIIPKEIKSDVLAKAKSGERVALLATQWRMIVASILLLIAKLTPVPPGRD